MSRRSYVIALGLALTSFNAGAKPRAPHRKPPVVFWIANMVRGATRREAAQNCFATTHYEGCARAAFAVRGPYLRTRATDPEDDPKVFVYRGADGVWYDREGNTPGCDPSGCP
jgi:hypothetical protein